MVKLSPSSLPFLVFSLILLSTLPPVTFTLDLPQFGPILERCFSSSANVHRHYSGLNETELECCLLEDIGQCHHRDCFTATTAAAATSPTTSASVLKETALSMECNSTALQLTRQLIGNACSKTNIPRDNVADYCAKRWTSVELVRSLEETRCRLTIWGLVSLLFLQAAIFIFWRQLTDVGRVVKNRCRNYVFFM